MLFSKIFNSYPVLRITLPTVPWPALQWRPYSSVKWWTLKLEDQKQDLIFAPKTEIPQNRYLDITSWLFGTEHTNFTGILEFEFLRSWSWKKPETRISWSRKPDFPGFSVSGMQSSDILESKRNQEKNNILQFFIVLRSFKTFVNMLLCPQTTPWMVLEHFPARFRP